MSYSHDCFPRTREIVLGVCLPFPQLTQPTPETAEVPQSLPGMIPEHHQTWPPNNPTTKPSSLLSTPWLHLKKKNHFIVFSKVNNLIPNFNKPKFPVTRGLILKSERGSQGGSDTGALCWGDRGQGTRRSLSLRINQTQSPLAVKQSGLDSALAEASNP